MKEIETKERINNYVNQKATDELLVAIEQLIAYHASGQKITPMTIDDLKVRINEARADRLAGRSFTSEQVKAYFSGKQS